MKRYHDDYYFKISLPVLTESVIRDGERLDMEDEDMNPDSCPTDLDLL